MKQKNIPSITICRLSIYYRCLEKPVAFIESSEYGGKMGISNKGGNPAASMAINKYSGGGEMGTYNKDGNSSVVMAISGNDNNNGVIFFYNKYGKLICTLP